MKIIEVTSGGAHETLATINNVLTPVPRVGDTLRYPSNNGLGGYKLLQVSSVTWDLVTRDNMGDTVHELHANVYVA